MQVILKKGSMNEKKEENLQSTPPCGAGKILAGGLKRLFSNLSTHKNNQYQLVSTWNVFIIVQNRRKTLIYKLGEWCTQS